MLTVEYYWNTPSLQGPLLLTYTMVGDGTRGKAALEPFPEHVVHQELRAFAVEDMRVLYESLSADPYLLMDTTKSPDSQGAPWTTQLVQDQLEWEDEVYLKAIIPLPGAAPGTSLETKSKKVCYIKVTVGEIEGN